MKRFISIALFLIFWASSILAQLTLKEQRQRDRLYNTGIEKLLEQDYTGALSAFEQCLDIDGTNARAYLQRARVYATLGEFEKSISDLDLAINYNRDLGEAYFYKGYFMFGKDTTGASAEHLQMAIEKGFELAEGYYYLGLQELLDGNDDAALIHFNKAVSLKDNYALAYHDRAGIKRRLGDFNGALYDYKTAVNYMENFPLAYNNMGSVKMILGDYAGAIRDFSVAIEQDSGLFLAFNNRGYAYYQLGNYDTAYIDFNTAVSIQGAFMEARLNKASVLVQIDDFEGAIEMISEIILSEPEEGILFLNRGLVKEMTGDLIGACQDWTTASELGIEEASDYLKECK